MKLYKTLIFCFFFSTGFAQVGGESVFHFLNISTAARQIALGGEALTLMDDVNQPIWNPAVINQEMDRKLSVNYASYLAGINIGSISYAKVLTRRKGTIHTSIKYLDYGTLIGADVLGNETGEFGASDIAASIGYAANLPWTNFFFGANIKLISSNISTYTSFGIASDFGIYYYSPYKPFSFTLVARNMGAQLKSYNGTNEKIPFKIALGASYQLEHVPLKWHLTLDNLQQWNVSVPNPSDQTTDLSGNTFNEGIGFIENTFRHLVIGAELFPKSPINLIIGYNFRRAAELSLQNVQSLSGISYGFGIKMKILKFNFALSKYHAATDTATFSLQFNLDKR